MIFLNLLSLCFAQETTTVEPETTTLFPISQFEAINGNWNFNNGNGHLSITENDAKTGVNIFIFNGDGAVVGLVQGASVTFGASSITVSGTNSMTSKAWQLVANAAGSSGSFTENGITKNVTKVVTSTSTTTVKSTTTTDIFTTSFTTTTTSFGTTTVQKTTK